MCDTMADSYNLYGQLNHYTQFSRRLISFTSAQEQTDNSDVV